MARDPLKQPGDGIHRAILVVLAISTVAGVLLSISGDLLARSEAVKNVGAGVALTSALLYLFFRLLGRREAKRRREKAGRDADDSGETH
ncbi:MAG: hypothetical protein AAF495_23655 [Pseudomonadota bacterium]